jgi:ribonucleoside-triphosphate reductase
VPPLLDVEGATHSLALSGLNEAVAFVTGEELHESDEALRLGRGVVGAVAVRCREQSARGFSVGADSESDPDVARRLADLDRAEYPELIEEIPDRYTTGVGLRMDAPVDTALRLDLEGRLGLSVRTTTVNMLLAEGEHPPPETVVALLRKMFRNTRIRQVLVGRGA